MTATSAAGMPAPATSAAATTGAAPSLISAAHLGVRLGGRAILDDVSMTVAPGEIVTLIGPNGAGKTVLIRTLLGLVRPSAGRVTRRRGLRIGYVPQRLVVDRILPLDVERFMTLGRPASRAEVEAALETTGVPAVIDRPVQRLSGGQFQRVLLARALLRDPELLVLDEPVQGVDIGGQRELYRLIRRLRDTRGVGVLLVSHDLLLVMAATDQVVCLNHHVCCTGHPEAVSRDPAYLALFGRDVAKDVAIYVHEHDHSHDVAGRPQPEPGQSHAHEHEREAGRG